MTTNSLIENIFDTAARSALTMKAFTSPGPTKYAENLPTQCNVMCLLIDLNYENFLFPSYGGVCWLRYAKTAVTAHFAPGLPHTPYRDYVMIGILSPEHKVSHVT